MKVVNLSSESEQAKKRLKLEDEEDEIEFKQNPAHQLKTLQSELDNRMATSTQLEQSLQIAKASRDDLEHRLAVETEKHVETRQQLNDLENKNQALEEMKQKMSELEKSFEDREQNLACKVEENLKSEGLIQELKEQLTTLQEQRYPDKLEECNKTISILKSELEFLNSDKEKIEEKLEEIETVNSGLREMVNTATTKIEEKDSEIKQVENKVHLLFLNVFSCNRILNGGQVAREFRLYMNFDILTGPLSV